MFQQLVLFTTSGHLKMNLGTDLTLEVTLTQEECATLRTLCERFYADRQHKVAAACIVPALADFTEISA